MAALTTDYDLSGGAGVTLGFVVQRYVWDGNVYLTDEQKFERKK